MAHALHQLMLRLPAETYHRLKAQAKARKTSMNALAAETLKNVGFHKGTPKATPRLGQGFPKGTPRLGQGSNKAFSTKGAQIA